MARGPRNDRAYGTTRWGRAVVDALQDPADTRRIDRARSYFQNRVVRGFAVERGEITAFVQGTQLDPFAVSLRVRQADTDTVLRLATEHGWDGDLQSLVRGILPAQLGELLIPTERDDFVIECSCPDETEPCIHALVVGFELAARIDADVTVLLSVVGAPVSLLRKAGAAAPSAAGRAPDESARPEPARSAPAPMRLPEIPRLNPVDPMSGDAQLLRTALRASGVRPGEIRAETDLLADCFVAVARDARARQERA